MAPRPERQGQDRSGRIGLALAGGGTQGAVYEIGVLQALDEVLEGVDFNDLHVYVGVSAGSFIAANLANNLTAAQMCRAIVKHQPGEHPFVSETFFAPATRELVGRLRSLPGLVAGALWSYVRNPLDHSLMDSMTALGQALPVAVFDNDRIREYLERIYSIKGRTNDFRKLGKHLVVVAADLDSGQAVRFGEPGLDDIPISVAVQASTALPGLYPPVEMDGRHYVDGVLLKTMHASVALDAGAKLVLCVNPFVPVDTSKAVDQGVMKRGKLIYRGLPTVLSQSLRTLIHSRMVAGVSAYDKAFPDSDVVLFEPRRDDYQMFFHNVFSFSSRRYICEHAYRATRQQLRERREELEPIFARHGVRLRADLLEDEEACLWQNVGVPGDRADPTVLVDLDRALKKLENLLD